jgi:hypothetical protein
MSPFILTDKLDIALRFFLPSGPKRRYAAAVAAAIPTPIPTAVPRELFLGVAFLGIFFIYYNY